MQNKCFSPRRNNSLPAGEMVDLGPLKGPTFYNGFAGQVKKRKFRNQAVLNSISRTAQPSISYLLSVLVASPFFGVLYRSDVDFAIDFKLG